MAAGHVPRIAAIVLAAGRSSRMGENKLLLELGGRPLIRHAAEAALAGRAASVVVVTGKDRERAVSALEGLAVTVVENGDYSDGLSTSLKCGLKNIPGDCDGALILLGDMPGIDAALIDRMIAAFAPAENRAICVATHGGKRGNPVLWARRFFPEMLAIEGDVGAKHLMAAHNELVCEIEAETDAPLVDLDTPEDLAAYRMRLS